MKNKAINLFGNNKIVQKEGVKYSTLLEQLIEPFVNDFAAFEYREDIFDFAINAWNISNIRTLLPEGEVDSAIDAIGSSDINLGLLKRMIDYKIDHFKTHTNFIIEYELKGTSRNPILSVITQEEEAFLANLDKKLEDSEIEENFEENYINRTAIMLMPLQPFIDWFTNLYPDEANNFIECNTYLLDEDIEEEIWLKKKFDKLFMMELEALHTDKKAWPRNRSYKMFKQWFHIEISTMVYDLEKYPVSKF